MSPASGVLPLVLALPGCAAGMGSGDPTSSWARSGLCGPPTRKGSSELTRPQSEEVHPVFQRFTLSGAFAQEQAAEFFDDTHQHF